MTNDPIVQEVHRTREQMWDECGGTLDGLIASFRETQAKHPERVISPDELRKLQLEKPPLPPTPRS